VPTRTAWI